MSLYALSATPSCGHVFSEVQQNRNSQLCRCAAPRIRSQRGLCARVGQVWVAVSDILPEF